MRGMWVTAMSNGNNNNGTSPSRWTIADWIMFTVGISGAGYELFVDPMPNYLKVVLILALLRLWTTVADLIRSK